MKITISDTANRIIWACRVSGVLLRLLIPGRRLPSYDVDAAFMSFYLNAV
jgi:hypothetical protein